MLKIIKPGLQTTIQDLGRYGYQRFGVIASGAMDSFAHRLANILVGNQENEATLEITMVGPEIQFENETLISICGADLDAKIDDMPIECWKPFLIKKGSVLRFGQAKRGLRAYLAVAGGFDVEKVMESRSTYLRAGLGGFMGRSVQAGDLLKIGKSSSLSEEIKKRVELRKRRSTAWSISAYALPPYQKNPVIRVIKGRQYHLFSEKSQKRFFTHEFEVTTQSDRMGYRLKGRSLQMNQQVDMISEAVTFGTIQVPSDGNPIVLLADRQTTGGYPKIAQIITVDLPLIAQTKPGDTLSFIDISHQEAEKLYFRQEREMNELKQAINLKIKRGE